MTSLKETRQWARRFLHGPRPGPATAPSTRRPYEGIEPGDLDVRSVARLLGVMQRCVRLGLPRRTSDVIPRLRFCARCVSRGVSSTRAARMVPRPRQSHRRRLSPLWPHLSLPARCATARRAVPLLVVPHRSCSALPWSSRTGWSSRGLPSVEVAQPVGRRFHFCLAAPGQYQLCLATRLSRCCAGLARRQHAAL